MDSEEERKFYENLSNGNKNATTFGNSEGPAYESVVDELKKLMQG